MSWRRSGPAEDGGQSLVEFALILPILLISLVGILDFGRGFQNYVALANAVRETAREASVHGSASGVGWGPAANDTNVTAAVRGRAVGLVAGDIAVTSSWPAGNNDRASEVVVSATYTFRPIALAFLGGVSVPMSATTRSRIYR